jgi:hypothetical protein
LFSSVAFALVFVVILNAVKDPRICSSSLPLPSFLLLLFLAVIPDREAYDGKTVQKNG